MNTQIIGKEDVMIDRVGVGNKVCSTCQYWTGVRSLETNRGYSLVESGAKGGCGIQMDMGQQAWSARSFCPKWERWPALISM